MIAESAQTSSIKTILLKLGAYAAFTKLRLTFLVVVSSAIGYGIGVSVFSWADMWWLSFSGFLVTGASNGFNQVIEKDVDLLMNRTKNRPLPTGAMSPTEGVIVASVLAIIGVAVLYVCFNTLAAVLAALALFTYVFIYTPLKGSSNWAVFAGAFPGAIPPMLGYVAATGAFDLYAGLLFAVQFVWQFPHFWAIAWVADDDYKRAGYQLLPSKGGKNAQSAFLTFVYTLFLIPVALLPWGFDLNSTVTAVLVTLAGIGFAYPALKLFQDRTDKAARTVMFASFFYLPLVQVLYLFDKLF